MSVRGWAGSIAVAICGAAVAGASQLGLGYGLGIISWQPVAGEAGEAGWVASLAWATWVAATSTIAGALAADRANPGPPVDATAGPRSTRLTLRLWQLALAVAAAVGALLTVAMIAIPARSAQRTDTFAPQTIAAGYAVVGVIVGLLAAVAALASRAVATNIILTTSWLWLLAVAWVVTGIAADRGPVAAQLAGWSVESAGGRSWLRNIHLPGAALAFSAALAIGGLTAWRGTARRPVQGISAAVSGAAGPLLVAAAYFLAAPRLVGVRPEQLSAYLIAPYTVLAGLAGSLLVTALAVRVEAGHDGAAADRRNAGDPVADHRNAGDPARERPTTGREPGSGRTASADTVSAGPADPTLGAPTTPGGTAAGTAGGTEPSGDPPSGTPPQRPADARAATKARRRHGGRKS